MRIVINEKQADLLVKQLMNEEYNFIDTQAEVVKKWLDTHFKPMDYEDNDESGYPIRKRGLCMLDSNGQPSETLITMEDGVDRLEAQFKKMYTDPKIRKEKLTTMLNNWWAKK
jgi:hypothetical protein